MSLSHITFADLTEVMNINIANMTKFILSLQLYDEKDIYLVSFK